MGRRKKVRHILIITCEWLGKNYWNNEKSTRVYVDGDVYKLSDTFMNVEEEVMKMLKLRGVLPKTASGPFFRYCTDNDITVRYEDIGMKSKYKCLRWGR